MTVVNSLIYFPQKEIYNSNEYYSARRWSSIIHHCHQACLLGMVPVLAQEIWKVFWNASVHVQVIWMQNDSWNGSKTSNVFSANEIENVTWENEIETLENENGTWNANSSCSYALEGNCGGLYLQLIVSSCPQALCCQLS